MSVLINGMKLPKFCRACRFAGFGGRQCELNVCMFTGESQPKLSPERMSKCPLVEIPLHGRLIDADVLNKKAVERSEKLGEQVNVLDKVLCSYDIKTAPTIIPAEEGDT